MLSREECVLSMDQRLNDVALKDAQIKLSEEECASNMGQRKYANYAVLKDAHINANEEEYARDTVHTAPLMKLLHRVLDQILIRLL